MNDWFDAEQHVERAHEAYDAGRWDEAENELREALSLNPGRAEWHFNLGLTLEAAGKADDAVKAYEEAHRLEPGEAHTLIALGVASLRADRPRDSVRWLEAAQALEPARADSYIHRIEAHARLGEHEQAETMYYLAQQCEGGDTPMALANLADSLLERGLHEKAIWCLREAAHQDPHLPDVHARLAEAYAMTGRLERARQLYLRELREDPGSIDTLLDLGDLLVEMGRLAEAGEKYRRALELESDHREAHFALGELALRQGSDRDALASFRTLLRLDPDYPGVRRRLASIMLRRGEIAEARRHLRADLRALRGLHQPGADDASDSFTHQERMELGDLLLDARLPADAAEVFRGVVAQAPGDAAALHALGVASFRAGDSKTGVRASRWALRAEPAPLPSVRLAALHNLALAHVREKQWARARVWLTRAEAVDADDPGVRRMRLILRARRAAFLGAMLARLMVRRRASG